MVNDPLQGLDLLDPVNYQWAIESVPSATATVEAGASVSATTQPRILAFTLATIKTGAPLNSTFGEVQVVSFPSGADSSVVCVFRVPDDLVTTQAMTLVLNYAVTTTPGVTNNKIKIKTRYTQNNGSASAFVEDTITLSNDTNWHGATGTNNTIPAGTLVAGDQIKFEIYRDVSVANNAAVAFVIAVAALLYVSKQ